MGDSEGLNLEGMKEAWQNLQEAWEEKDYGVVVTNLLVIADQIGKVSPVLAPVVFQVIEKYGATTRPIFDEMFKSGTKFAAYLCDNIATTKTDLLSHIEKLVSVEAQIHAMNLKAYQKAGFSRREAMDILLAKISGARQSRKSWLDSLKNLKPNSERNRNSGY